LEFQKDFDLDIDKEVISNEADTLLLALSKNKLHLKSLWETLAKTMGDILNSTKVSYTPEILKKWMAAAMLSGVLLWAVNEAEAEVRNSTAIAETTIRIATINRTNAILDIMRICTQFESWDDIDFYSSTFIETWGRRGYMSDWDNDGVEEACIQFESSAQIMNYRLTQSADIVLRPAAHMDQIAMRDANGRTLTFWQVRWGTIEDFFPRIPNPYSTITFTPDVNGSILGVDGIDCGEDSEGDICESDIYWGRTKYYDQSPIAWYNFSHFTGCDAIENDRCRVDGDGPKTIKAFFSEIPPTLWDVQVNIEVWDEDLWNVSSNNGIDCGNTGTDCLTTAIEWELYEMLISPNTGYEAIVTGCETEVANPDGSITCAVTPTSDVNIGVDFQEIVVPPTLSDIQVDIEVWDENLWNISGDNGLDCGNTGTDCNAEVIDWNLYEMLINPNIGYEAIVTGCETEVVNLDGSITCGVTPTSDMNIGVDFQEIVVSSLYTVNVVTNYSGVIFSSNMPGIDCAIEGDDCSEVFWTPTELELTVSPYNTEKKYNINWSNMPECKNLTVCTYDINQDMLEVSVDLSTKFAWNLFLPTILNAWK